MLAKLLLVATLLATAPNAFAVVFSEWLVQGGVSVMVGVYNPQLLPDLPFYNREAGVQVTIKTTNADTDAFDVRIIANIDGEIVTKRTAVKAAKPDNGVIATLAFGRTLKPEEVIAISVTPKLKPVLISER